MCAVSLPQGFSTTEADAARLRDALLYDHRIEVPIFTYRGKLWTRLSFQVYNELDDVERFASAVEKYRA